jgi:hypothetical protein
VGGEEEGQSTCEDSAGQTVKPGLKRAARTRTALKSKPAIAPRRAVGRTKAAGKRLAPHGGTAGGSAAAEHRHGMAGAAGNWPAGVGARSSKAVRGPRARSVVRRGFRDSNRSPDSEAAPICLPVANFRIADTFPWVRAGCIRIAQRLRVKGHKEADGPMPLLNLA